MRSVRRFLSIVALVALGPLSVRAADSASIQVDWATFLSRQDLVWSRVPSGWRDSVFIGNGNLGATVCMESGKFGWQINRTDVTHDGSRYPIGRLVVRTAGRIQNGDARLKLWDAEAQGTLETTTGVVRWRTLAATTPAIIMIELKGSSGEAGVSLEWEAAEARPPRKVYRKEPFAESELHPAAEVVRQTERTTSVQTFIGGGAHAESILEQKSVDGGKWYAVAIEPGASASEALAAANRTTAQAVEQGVEKITQAHRQWWHAYYPQSFLSVPDARLEAFYWIQIYKLGSAMRAEGPILDLMGPWFAPTPWPKIWWNLNVQLTYSPLFAANRLAQAESLFRALDRHRVQLLNNVSAPWRGRAAVIGTASGADLVSPVDVARGIASGKGSEMGNLPWVLFLYWQYYVYQQDDVILRERVLPLLKPTINQYLEILEKGADGRWHLPVSYSPELVAVPDCNYDLALLRWGLETLIASAQRVQPDEPLLPRWKEVLTHLTPPPSDATGLLVGRDRPLVESHRHYSHLLAVYPLRLLNAEVPVEREVIEKSLENWTSRPEQFKGYSYTGAASMEALLGRGDAAQQMLSRMLDRFILPNTFYVEAGPVIETPLSVATSLQEMLLQSGTGGLRVFPAIPSEWSEASFYDLRGEGAFLVSAVRHQGRTNWVRIHSLAGAPCRLRVPDWKNAVVRSSSGSMPRVTVTAPGDFTVDLAKGASAVLESGTEEVLVNLQPVASAPDATPAFPKSLTGGKP